MRLDCAFVALFALFGLCQPKPTNQPALPSPPLSAPLLLCQPPNQPSPADALRVPCRYSAAYAKLANASRSERPALVEIADPKQYLETALARIAGPR